MYEWPSIFLWVFVMHICVRMTINFFLYGFSSCTFMYEWLSIFFLYRFLSCIFLYEWLSIFLGVFVMHICVQMTIHIIFVWFFVVHNFFTNDYPYSFGFIVMYIFVQMTICYQFLSNSCLLNRNSELLGVFSSNVSVSPCAQSSQTLEERNAINTL